MNKKDFMELLGEALREYNVTDAREILIDFEQHFEDGIAAGETEEQVCDKLGDPIEIAKQYIPEVEVKVENKVAEQNGFDSNDYKEPPVQSQPQYAPPQPVPPQNTGFQPDVGKIIGILLVDLLIFTWALPTLISLVASLYGITVGFGAGGLVIAIAGAIMEIVDISEWFFTSLSMVPTILFGVMLMAATPLLVIASIASTKGTINVFKRIINWHSRAFTGKNVCTIKKKGEEQV